jgi:glucose-6-phosphate dehydrogenase assembly protein OpcA
VEDVVTAAVAASDRSVPLKDVEMEVSRQLRGVHPDSAGVQRTCMSNLIVFCDELDQAAEIEEHIPDILALHPARVLLLIAQRQSAGAELSARVGIRSRHPDARCSAWSEQITLHARGQAVEGLPFSVRTLIIGELPTNLWWATPEPPGLAGPLLFELAEHANQIIYDSIGWIQPARGVAGTASWLPRIEGGGRRLVSDLNWRRLKYWRRLLTQALDPERVPDALGSIVEVLVEHGPHAVVQAWELMSWLAGQLSWRVQAGRIQPNVEITWKAESPRRSVRLRLKRLEQGPPEIRRARIVWEGGRPGAINFRVEDEQHLSATPEEPKALPRTLTIHRPSLAELVARQLCDRDADPAFRRSMAVAQTLARGLLQ